MGLKKVIILFGFVVMVAVTQIVLAEEAVVASVDPAVIASNQQATLGKEIDMQWAWGEVTNLDSQAKTINLKYLDYEADQEKDLILLVDEKTTFENIKDFSELKLKDTLSVDYIIGADNKNIAKNISLEKPDDSLSVPALPEAAAPDLAQPVVKLETPVDSSTTVNEAPQVAPVESSPVPVVESAPVAIEPALAVQGQAQ
jgi:hypothetical protein